MDKNILTTFLILVVIVCLEGVIIHQLRKKVKDLTPRYKVSKAKFRRLDFNSDWLCALDNLDGVQFENLCCELLHELGYINILKTRVTGDFGLDIICEKNGVKYGIQCKCYNNSVGIDAVQQAYSGCAYYKCDVPVVMTNDYFTDAAQELGRVLGVHMWSRIFFVDNVNKIKHRKRMYKRRPRKEF